jgi:hypothetical protein
VYIAFYGAKGHQIDFEAQPASKDKRLEKTV